MQRTEPDWGIDSVQDAEFIEQDSVEDVAQESIEATAQEPVEEVSQEPVEATAQEPVEIIGEEPDPVYKPRLDAARARAEREGNLIPLVGALKAHDASDEIIKKEITEVTISSCLRKSMAMPNEVWSSGDKIVNNAEVIGSVLMNKAIAGDMAAIREILNRTEGKVPNVTHNSSASVRVTGDANSIGSLMAKIDKNRGGEQ